MVSGLHKGVHSSLTAGVSALDYSFSYDDKGRLSGSTLATGGSTIYQMTMGYNAAGGITSKVSVRPGAHPLVDPNLDYELSYTYNPTKPHQLLSVSDAGPNGGLTHFNYDGVGNLMNMSGPSGAEELIWNELQQLSGVKNRGGIHHYVYDHSGERIMKSSINRSSVQVNDQTIDDIPYLEPYTLYVNPYFVVTSFHNGDRASKHYYMNTQRVATDISINYQGPPPPAAQGAQGTLNGTQTNPIGLSASFEQDINQVMQQFDAGEIAGDLAAHAIAIENYYPKAPAESESTNRILYWYHPDYLGSVDLVTDRNGLAYEFFLYTPWGEDMYHYNARTSSFSSPYRFNGKEKDPETGYHYYGARYYQSKFSVWMSVDPLAHLRSWVSPYNFVQNNPINRVDPTGALDDWVESADGEIYWDENATSQATTKEGETYLGKNVLVGTHNRDASGNEEINTAQFDLYLESDKTGPSATIMGNTVPADIEKYGTVAEGLYPAEYSIYKGDGAILINGGGNLPTVSGNPNNRKNYNADGSLKPISEHVIDEVFFHKGNYARKSLSTSWGSPISAGCQTGGCGPGTLPTYREFIKNAEGFNGSYYLRAKPVLTVPKIVPFSSEIKGGN